MPPGTTATRKRRCSAPDSRVCGHCGWALAVSQSGQQCEPGESARYRCDHARTACPRLPGCRALPRASLMARSGIGCCAVLREPSDDRARTATAPLRRRTRPRPRGHRKRIADNAEQAGNAWPGPSPVSMIAASPLIAQLEVAGRLGRRRSRIERDDLRRRIADDEADRGTGHEPDRMVRPRRGQAGDATLRGEADGPRSVRGEGPHLSAGTTRWGREPEPALGH